MTKQLKYPIYIPSKGRWENMRTVKLLEANGIHNWFIVIEPYEFKFYAPLISPHNILKLMYNDYGSSTPARNFCIEHAKRNGHKKLWMLDDDITSIFAHAKGKKYSTNVLSILAGIEAEMDRVENIKVIGMPTSASFLKTIKPGITLNTSLSSIYLLTITEGIRFRGTMLVDMDYQLQVLRKGFQTARLNDYAFAFITPTKIKGGYYHIYKDDKRRRKAIEEFCALNTDVDPTIVRNSTGFLVLKNIGKIWRKFK